MGRRRAAREAALQALYLLGVSSYPSSENDALLSVRRGTNPQGDKDDAAFCEALVSGARAKMGDVDAAIESAAQNWSLERMALVDKTILRLAAYELLFSPQTPPKAVIDEAIEITRKFSSEESTKFVNGVLDKIARGAKSHDSPESSL